MFVFLGIGKVKHWRAAQAEMPPEAAPDMVFCSGWALQVETENQFRANAGQVLRAPVALAFV